MRYLFFLFGTLFGLLSLTGCQEEIQLSPSGRIPQLVVDGRISNELKRHEVRLSLSGDFAGADTFPPVSGAVLRITDGVQEIMLGEKRPGVYLTDSIEGTPGRIYTLLIDWEGKTYSARDSMRGVPETFDPVIFTADGDRFDFEYRRHQFGFPEADMWDLIIFPDEPDYDLDVSDLGLQVGVDVLPGGIYVFNFFTHPTIEVNGLLNFEESHFYGFFPGKTVEQRRYALSESYYAFLRSQFMETEWRGTLFDTTPANLKGNVSNGALGFFGAVSVRSEFFRLD